MITYGHKSLTLPVELKIIYTKFVELIIYVSVNLKSIDQGFGLITGLPSVTALPPIKFALHEYHLSKFFFVIILRKVSHILHL